MDWFSASPQSGQVPQQPQDRQQMPDEEMGLNEYRVAVVQAPEGRPMPKTKAKAQSQLQAHKSSMAELLAREAMGDEDASIGAAQGSQPPAWNPFLAHANEAMALTSMREHQPPVGIEQV